ncbi:MAG: hypothetical protein ACRC6V_02860 [Bacteroidales bacterium]
MTKIKIFENLDYLHVVRNDHLNPLIRKVENEIVPVVDLLEEEMQKTFKDVTLDTTSKILKFERSAGGGFQQIELEPIMPEFEGIGVENDKGVGPGSGIHNLVLKDANVTRSGDAANIEYDWAKIVGDNTKDLQVGTLAGGNKPVKYLFFKGANVTYTGNEIATVDVPVPPSQIMASIQGTPSVAIKEIILEGDTAASSITDDKLTINLSSGGGVAPVSSDNFKGFFASLGDLKEKVKDPVNGKSYAFAQDGGSYYVPYLYINNKWIELKQTPSLTYKAPGEPLPEGVFTIKPSDKIKVSEKGELDLDGLSTPQLPSHFKGFFTTLDELKTEVPNPVLHQDWAYVRNNASGGLLAYRSDQKGSARLWSVIAPLGSLALVDRVTTPNNYKQAFGIYKDDNWEMDDKGLLSLKSIDTSTKVIITDPAGVPSEGDITSIKFEGGKSLAEITNKEVTIHHPQRIINHTATWEDTHKVEDYRGSLFYDATSKTWMGCNDPDTGGGVGVKWTRVVHRGMSDEVKSLVRRVPAKAPDVIPGNLGDHGLWAFNGVTYIEQYSEHLPEDFKDQCGGYITTSVQDKDKEGVTIPQYRMQTCVADRDEGGTYVRRWKMNGSPGASVEWSPWVRTSFSHKDMEAHMADPGAHKSVIKYYRGTSFSANCILFANQSEGGSPGGIRATNCDLMFDNYGSVSQGEDYMDVPYKGDFRISGNIAFAGYKENNTKLPEGRWQVLVRIQKIGTTEWRTINQFTYEQTSKTGKFLPMSFETDKVEMEPTDKVVINITFSNNAAIQREHPALYYVPMKSYVVIEDFNTHVGSYMAKTISDRLSSVDTFGEVGVRVHHSDPDRPTSAIRVYGENLTKKSTPMNKV